MSVLVSALLLCLWGLGFSVMFTDPGSPCFKSCHLGVHVVCHGHSWPAEAAMYGGCTDRMHAARMPSCWDDVMYSSYMCRDYRNSSLRGMAV